MFCHETLTLDYREKTRDENQQLFEGIIDITLFAGVEGLLYSVLRQLPENQTVVSQISGRFQIVIDL